MIVRRHCAGCRVVALVPGQEHFCETCAKLNDEWLKRLHAEHAEWLKQEATE